MATYKILISDGLDADAVELMKGQPSLAITLKSKMTPEELLAEIPAYHAIVVRSASKVTRPVIEAGVNLKLITRAGVGLDNVDQVAAREKGIEVRNTPTCTSISVAELAFGMMLSLARHVGKANISMKNGEWNKKAYMGTELYGKTLGLIGSGRIGQSVAVRAQAFGMSILAYDKFATESPLPIIKMVSLDELLENSDYISLHIPFDKEAGPTLTAKEFGKMKKGAYLINCARGGTVAEKDLLQALEAGTIAGAAIDVWEKEPTENVTLAKHPNVLATPHLGASAQEGQARTGMDVANIIIETFAK